MNKKYFAVERQLLRNALVTKKKFKQAQNRS